MVDAFMKSRATLAAWAMGLALIGAQYVRADGPEAQPPQLNRSDLAPATLQQADALIEQYLQPVAEPEPTPQERYAIDSALQMLKSGQPVKQEIAIKRLNQIGPPALDELHRLADTEPAEDTASQNPAGEENATMAAIIIRQIEAAQRQPIVQELISLGDAARAVLSLKLEENKANATMVEERIEAATASLVKAAANTTIDAPAVAAERKALAEAQMAQRLLEMRRDMLTELNGLITPKPPAQPPAAPPEQPPATPPPNVQDIQPISPPTGYIDFGNSETWPYTPLGPYGPPFIYTPPAITFPAMPPMPPRPSRH